MQWFDRILILALILTIAVTTVVWLLRVSRESLSEVSITGTTVFSTKGIQLAKIKVHVKGAVRKPGVYEFNVGQRVEDAIKKAGGELPTADLEALNLAAFLKDGDEVFVPDKRVRALESFSEAMDISQKPSPSSRSKVRHMPTGKIPINTAAAEQLENLPGIGPALAHRIVEYRKKNGPFKSIDELLNVKGIGQKKLEALRPYVRLW